MSIARSLRKAGYLKPVADALGRYIASEDRKKRKEEFNQMIQSAVGGIENIGDAGERTVSRAPLGSGGSDPNRPLGIPRSIEDASFQDIPEVTGGLSPDDQRQSYQGVLAKFGLDTLGQEGAGQAQTALSQLVSSKTPEPQKAVETKPYRVGDTVFGRDEKGQIDFSKKVYEEPEPEEDDKIVDRYTGDDGKRHIVYESGKERISEGRVRTPKTSVKTPGAKSYNNLEKAITGHKKLLAGSKPFTDEFGDTSFFKDGKQIEESGLISSIESSRVGLKSLQKRMIRENKAEKYTTEYDKYIKEGGDKEDILYSIEQDPSLSDSQRKALKLYYDVPNE